MFVGTGKVDKKPDVLFCRSAKCLLVSKLMCEDIPCGALRDVEGDSASLESAIG